MNVLIMKNFTLRKAILYREEDQPRIFSSPEEAAEKGDALMAAEPGKWEFYSTMGVVKFIDIMAKKFEIDQ